MIHYSEALELIKQNPLVLSHQTKLCSETLGFFIAEDVFAPIDLPPFTNSAVDGFAVETKDSLKTAPIVGENRAVAQEPVALPKGTTMRVMTGAPLPLGANAVVMKEDVQIHENIAHFQKMTMPNNNLRFVGEDIKRGAKVLTAGDQITPQRIGLLYGLGIDRIAIKRPPSVHVISTGDELVNSGNPLAYGQVYYLIGPMLRAQCQLLGVLEVTLSHVKDDKEAISLAIAECEADIILISGGMSKGDYDFVRPALNNCRVSPIFYEGAWRPGKPLYFGRKNNQFIFGLPGNPVAAFVCFHVFVRTLIYQAMGAVEKLKPHRCLLTESFAKKAGFTFFARALVEEGKARVFSAQGSHHLSSLSQANALLILPRENEVVLSGQEVSYYPLY